MTNFATMMNDGELAARMQVTLVTVNDEEVVEYIPVAGNTQPFGVIHGGANAFLVEDAASRLALMNAPEGRIAVGTELNITHLAANKTERAQAHAYVIGSSASSLTAGVDIVDATGELMASGRMTCVFIRQPAQ